MNNNWQFALTLGAIIAGIFFNQRAADKVRSDLMAEINALRSDIKSLTAKVSELGERIAFLEGKEETKTPVG